MTASSIMNLSLRYQIVAFFLAHENNATVHDIAIIAPTMTLDAARRSKGTYSFSVSVVARLDSHPHRDISLHLMVPVMIGSDIEREFFGDKPMVVDSVQGYFLLQGNEYFVISQMETASNDLIVSKSLDGMEYAATLKSATSTETETVTETETETETEAEAAAEAESAIDIDNACSRSVNVPDVMVLLVALGCDMTARDIIDMLVDECSVDESTPEGRSLVGALAGIFRASLTGGGRPSHEEAVGSMAKLLGIGVASWDRYMTTYLFRMDVVFVFDADQVVGARWRMLLNMCRRLACVMSGLVEPDERDSCEHQRVLTTGQMLHHLTDRVLSDNYKRPRRRRGNGNAVDVDDGDDGDEIVIGTIIVNVDSDGEDWDDGDNGRVPDAAAVGIPVPSPCPVSHDLATYTTEIEAVKATPLKQFNKEDEFHTFCNFPIDEIAKSIADISQARSNVYLSAEQTNKGMTAAACCKIAHVMAKPSAMLVGDLKANIANMCKTKIDRALQQFGINAINPSGSAAFARLSNDAEQMLAVREGRVTLVVQAIDNNLKLLNDLYRTHNISDIVVVLDESDAMWSCPITAGEPMTQCDLTSREKQLYDLLAGKGADGVGLELFGNNRVRCLFQISASHVATLEWHSMWRCPYGTRVVELSLVINSGISECRLT
ncbi:hypothetical protein FOA52_000972 [Chlamydomonas sp. UWO 241]|nr:hypothetical protein FOA52_000972 [Chlamydomonas sp. UWO 241]